jgi:hypothetical protein
MPTRAAKRDADFTGDMFISFSSPSHPRQTIMAFR